MDGVRRVLALAAFELRLNLRLVRGAILGGIATLVGLATAAQYLVLHRLFSGFSAPWAFNTRDLWVLQSCVNLGIFLGLLGVFLAFDWRHRDQATHFAGTLDASPLTRLEHAWGKFLGLAPVVLWPLGALLVGHVAGMAIAGVWLPPSVFAVSYLTLAVPFALGPVAVAFGVAGLSRNQALGRALAIVLGIAWIALTFGAVFKLDEKYAVVAGTLTELPFHSSFVGYEVSLLSILQRIAAFLQVAFFVSLASLGPLGLSRDGREAGRRAAVVVTLGLLWCAALAGVYRDYVSANAERRAILAAEESARAARAPVRLRRRDLEVNVAPGRAIQGVAALTLAPAASGWPQQLALRLNEGLTVSAVTCDGAPAAFERDHTVLRVTLPALGPAPEARVTVTYSGRPTPHSVDAGAVLAESAMTAQERNNRRILGNAALYFDRAIVVLGLDAAWYPDPALLLGARYPELERPDIVPGSLSVTLPAGWLAASVGRRSQQEGTVRFESDVPVPGFCLVASRYEEATARVNGLPVRLLYRPDHGANIAFFSEAKDQILERAGQRLESMRASTGLVYPHPELTFVEVPQLIGVHASGWDAMNRLGQPGVVMLREGQIFRARFENALKRARDRWQRRGGAASGASGASGPSGPAGLSGASGPASGSGPSAASGPAAESGPSGPSGASGPAGPAGGSGRFDQATAKADILERFVATDFTGADIERLVLRSAWDWRVQPAGEAAAIVGLALPSAVAETALGRYVPDTPETARVLQSVIGESVQLFQAGRANEVGEAVMRSVAEPDQVWALMQETPLDAMNPAAKPAEFAGVMFVKGRRPFLAVRQVLGREAFAAVIGDLLARAGSGPVSWSDLRSSILAHADPASVADLEHLLDAWRAGTELPGFTVERARAFRLPGQAEQWQAIAVVVNRGTGAGTALLAVGEGDGAVKRLVSVPAGAAVEVDVAAPTKPERWSLQPYLALNRTPPAGSFDVLDAPEWGAASDATRPAPPEPRPRLVVDNVDPGFKVVVDGKPLGWNDRDATGQRRLPRVTALWRAPGDWRRWTARPLAQYRPFGFFDESAAVKSGVEKGKSPATWTASLPAPGRWRVDTYLPSEQVSDNLDSSKTLTYIVRHAGGETTVPLVVDPKKAGWSDLGAYDFGATGEVTLLDEGKGVIIADAVRFTKEGP